MERRELVLAFRELIESATKTSTDKLYRAVPLEEHPFGLTMSEFGKPWSRWGLQFIGHPRVTDIASMRKEAVKILIGPIGDYDKQCLRLRVILAEADEARKDEHFVFYEMANASTSIMCGGCTDFSGTGGSGKISMDALFAILADFYKIQIETVIIPYAVTCPAIWAIEQAIADYRRG